MNKDIVRIRLYRLLGKSIRDARREPGRELTQQALAESTDGTVRRSTLANIEVGKQQISIYQLYLVARALGVEPQTLLPASVDVFGDENDVLRLIEEKLGPGARQWADRVMTNATQSAAGKGKTSRAKPSTD